MSKEVEDVVEKVEVIDSYSRAEALEDGVLIDVPEEDRRAAGFLCHVAMTQAVHQLCVVVPPRVSGQCERGRLWDILHMLRFVVRVQGAQREVHFKVNVRNNNRRDALMDLKALCGPGDRGEPVITICLPNED